MLGEELTNVIPASIQLDHCVANQDSDNLRQALRHYHEATLTWLKQRHDFQTNHSQFVTDRCCFDALCSWMSTLRNLNIKGRENNLITLINIFQKQSRQFDLIVVLPILQFSLDLSKNEEGFQRDSDLLRKISCLSHMLGLMSQFCSTPIFKVSNKNLSTEQRIALIEQYIDHTKKKRAALG